MISAEYNSHPNSNTIEENSNQLDAENSLLEETNVHTETSNLEVSRGLVEIQSKINPIETEQRENRVHCGEQLNTGTVLNTKELVYSIPVSRNSSTNILSLNESDTLSSNDGSIVPTISENNFEVQTGLPTTQNSLLEGFISHTQKEKISQVQIDNTVLDDGIDKGIANNDDHAILTESNEEISRDLEDLPPWAARLKGCERIGDSYRGYVHTEAELDILLSMHKEHTNSSWGTRQSPSSQKPSVRFMWKSQYVPYDGIPFLNSGRRATVMECQYGPRRKGSKVKIECGENGEPMKRAHRPTCPARIYIKRVRKFPEYKVDKSFEGTPGLRLAQERALTALRVACLESRGEERFYVQFPLEIAHEYHHDDDEMMPHQALSILPTQVNLGSSRLDPRVVDKINELVARGVTDTYEVKHGVINFVEKDLFLSGDEPIPARHNKSFFPTITDLQNHIHQAILALDSGTLESLPPPENLPKPSDKDDRSRKRKRTEPRRVRASKTTPLRTICIRTDDPLELNKDTSILDGQGQVYVMVPSGNGLFSNSESLVGTSLEADKTTSLVQVLTVPSSGNSTFIGQQADGTLDFTGQFLALPVMHCENTEQVTNLHNSGLVVHGKEHVTSTTMENILNKQHSVDVEIPMKQIPTASMVLSTPISPTSVTMTSPSVTIGTQRSPPCITIVTPSNTITPNTLLQNVQLEKAKQSRTSAGIPLDQTRSMACDTKNAMIPNLETSAIPITAPELMTSTNVDLRPVQFNTSSSAQGVQAASLVSTIKSPEISMTSTNLTQAITSETPSNGLTIAITSLDTTMASAVPTTMISPSIT